MDSVSEARLQEVYPELAKKIRTLHDMLELEGIEIRVVQGFRTINQQNALYAQGRTAPGKIVTNCQGGHSYHNYGLAVDCVPSTHGPGELFDPDWNANHVTWKRMSDVGQSLGLVSGAAWRTFPDAPHFQFTGRFPVGAPDGEARQIAADAGVVALWQEVTKSLS
jgi:peptidoglycan L-alanyl-D-glutamate endopeptidase CwlK